jgi:glycosyltransferase involved in cell wall biosynthesis
MKIAWFTHRYFPCLGGSENYGREMVRRFVNRGETVDVMTTNALDLWYFTDPRKQAINGPLQSVVDGARVIRFPVRHFPGQRYVGRLLSYLPHWPTRCRHDSFMPWVPGLGRVRGDYDAVFGVGFPYTGFSYAAWQTARASGAALVLTPFLHLATPGDPVHRTYTRPHQARLLRGADRVIVQTELESATIRGWGVPRHRILKLGMAVQHEQVTGGDRRGYRARVGIAPGRTVIGQLGANDPNKGTTHLIEAVASLNRQRPASDPIHLLLAGPQSPSFMAFRAALPGGEQHWLTVLGPIPDPDRAGFLAALDVYAMPSRTDSFGIVFLEAWANALPVVAAASGGVVEVVEHGRTGLLVPFGDVAALADTLRRLVEDPALAARLGQAGASHVARGFSWDDRFTTLAACVDHCLEERRPRQPRPRGLRPAWNGRHKGGSQPTRTRLHP